MALFQQTTVAKSTKQKIEDERSFSIDNKTIIRLYDGNTNNLDMEAGAGKSFCGL